MPVSSRPQTQPDSRPGTRDVSGRDTASVWTSFHAAAAYKLASFRFEPVCYRRKDIQVLNGYWACFQRYAAREPYRCLKQRWWYSLTTPY